MSYLLLLRDADLHEKLAHVVPLIALQLHHLTILWVLNNTAIACELLRTDEARASTT